MTPVQGTPGAVWPIRRDWLVLAGALVLLYVFMLGSRGLNEPDETRYANIALAMLRPPGDWWEPRMSGYGHYDKPPLIYWATALSFRAFGVHEWAARLPSLGGALFALAGLGWTAYRLRGERVAWWAVLLCGTSAQLWVFGRILSPDMLLTGWCALAMGAWSEAKNSEEEISADDRQAAGPPTQSGNTIRRRSWGWWLLSLLFWTLAWWTKATPALVPLLGLTVGVFVTRDRPGQRALCPWLLLPAVIALGSPWYLSMMHTYPELKGFFFGRELAGRLVGSVDGRHGAWWYYAPVCLWSWLPWWPVAIWAAWRVRAARHERATTLTPNTGGSFSAPRVPSSIFPAVSAFRVPRSALERLGVEGWLVLTGLLILSLTSSKLHSYTLPLLPWVALLMARAVTAVSFLPGGNLRTPLLLPAAGFALVACFGIATLPPRRETRLGMNTSLREVSRFLRQQGATRVDTDRYWSGLEFYLGADTVHYALRIDDASAPGDDPAARIDHYHERDSDAGAPPNRFVDPTQWPALPPDTAPPRPPVSWWFVRFYKRPKPIFDRTLQDPDPARRPVMARRIGDFDVYRMPSGAP